MTGRAELAAQLRVVEQAGDRAGQRLLVPGLDEQARLFFDDELW